MCFSAPASFIAGGGLIALGGASVAVAKKEDKILAAIPLMFGIQQALEGVQWLYLGAGSSSLFAGYGFLFFAFIVWPVYVPLTVYMLDKKRRSTLRWFVFIGAVVALYYLATFLTQSVSIQELRACVSYGFASPFGSWGELMAVPYLLVIFAPLLLSHRPLFQWFGVAVAALAVIAWLFYAVVFTSVWCFFAAIVSSLIFFYILADRKQSRSHRLKN